MAGWEDPAKVDEVLRALGARLDGTWAAASSVKRNRRILNVAMAKVAAGDGLSGAPVLVATVRRIFDFMT